MEVIKLKSESLYEAKRSYSRAVCVDDFIFLANTAGRNFTTRFMSDDAVEQTRQCLANIRGSLEAVEATLADIVRIRISIPYSEHKEAIMEVVAETFRGIDPAATITACPLSSPDYLVEIEATACRGVGAANAEKRTVRLGP